MENQTKSNLTEILLITALIFAPYTALRFSFFGIAEIFFMAVWLMIYKDGIVIDRDPQCFVFTKALLGILIFSLIGWAWNIFIFQYNSGTTSSALFNLFSIIFVTVTIYAIEISEIKNTIDYGRILYYSFWGLSLGLNIFLILYFFTSSIGPLSLATYYMFCPLADNIHQIAMISVQLPFIGGYFASKEKNIIKKLVIYALSFGDIIASWMTYSTKAKMGIVIGIMIVLFYFIVFNKRFDRKSKVDFFVISIGTLMCVSLLLLQKILSWAIAFFSSNDGGGARKELYSSAIEIVKKSPFFGLGPSCHVIYDGRYFDAHETFLTVALMSGIIGVLFLMVLYFKVFFKLIQSGWLLAAYSTILIYALGGDILRRLPVWVLLILMYLTIKKENEKIPE